MITREPTNHHYLRLRHLADTSPIVGVEEYDLDKEQDDLYVRATELIDEQQQFIVYHPFVDIAVLLILEKG